MQQFWKMKILLLFYCYWFLKDTKINCETKISNYRIIGNLCNTFGMEYDMIQRWNRSSCSKHQGGQIVEQFSIPREVKFSRSTSVVWTMRRNEAQGKGRRVARIRGDRRYRRRIKAVHLPRSPPARSQRIQRNGRALCEKLSPWRY